MNPTAWGYLDGKIDRALHAVRTTSPDPDSEKQALNDLLTALH